MNHPTLAPKNAQYKLGIYFPGLASQVSAEVAKHLSVANQAQGKAQAAQERHNKLVDDWEALLGRRDTLRAEIEAIQGNIGTHGEIIAMCETQIEGWLIQQDNLTLSYAGKAAEQVATSERLIELANKLLERKQADLAAVIQEINDFAQANGIAEQVGLSGVSSK